MAIRKKVNLENINKSKILVPDIEIKELSDVSINNPQNDELLIYDNNTSKWVNKASSGYILYDTAGDNTDGAMTQKATTDEIETRTTLDNLQDLGTLISDTNIDCKNGNSSKAVINNDVKISLSANCGSTSKSRSVGLLLENAGSHNVTWDNTIKWENGTPPTLTSNGKDLLSFITIDNGASWYGKSLSELHDVTNPREWDWDKVAYTVTSPGGRKVARHPSGKGTVMSYDDDSGHEKTILVLDAQYRAKSNWSTGAGYCYYSEYIDINTLLPADKQLQICTMNGYVSPDAASGPIPYPFVGCNDNDIKSSPNCAACNQDNNDSKYNTDCLVSLGEKAEAANYCRNITVEGVGCDLPSINALARIYAEMLTLDSMDPTIASYSDNSTENIFDNSDVVSSSYIGDTYGSLLCRKLERSSFIYYNSLTYKYSVIPIIEIEC